ncbi:MAG TPA: hypothetical protein VFS15_06765 [Kofleriaceae bacterium]|nr:hypothetical protein [Kofleriaceae bacterium]
MGGAWECPHHLTAEDPVQLRDPRSGTGFALGWRVSFRPAIVERRSDGPVTLAVQYIAAQRDFPAAVRAIHTEGKTLTQSDNVLCVLFAGGIAAAAPDGGRPKQLDAEVRRLVELTATTGRRTLLGRIAIEPIGPAPARAVLICHRAPAASPYRPGELATLSAFAVGLQAVFPRLLAL